MMRENEKIRARVFASLRMTGFSRLLDARQRTGMSDCLENACAEGTLECGGLTPP